MRPPLAGKRDAVRRLAGRVRRAKPGPGPAPSAAAKAESEAQAVTLEPPKLLTPAEAADRIDAARDRLRATIQPPAAEPD